MDAMREMSNAFADGFQPGANARIIKLCRSGAQADFFQPDRWELPDPVQIFQFAQTLAMAVVLHAATHSQTKQYFFWPASRQLQVMCRRAFRHIHKTLQPSKLVPILEPTGGFDGYQRT